MTSPRRYKWNERGKNGELEKSNSKKKWTAEADDQKGNQSLYIWPRAVKITITLQNTFEKQERKGCGLGRRVRADLTADLTGFQIWVLDNTFLPRSMAKQYWKVQTGLVVDAEHLLSNPFSITFLHLTLGRLFDLSIWWHDCPWPACSTVLLWVWSKIMQIVGYEPEVWCPFQWGISKTEVFPSFAAALTVKKW